MKLYLSDELAAGRRRETQRVFWIMASATVAFLALILLLEYLIAVTMGSPGF
jgi:lipopolysaccharide/colanic/teichoic acid biosynthesis glycosyltransferase